MLSHLVERREEIIGDATAYLRYLSTKFGGGATQVNDYTALNHSAVWAGLDFVSSTLAMLPIQLRRKLNRDVTVGEDEDEREISFEYSERVSSPLSRMVSLMPNPRVTGYRWRQMQQASAMLHGNGYAWIERDGNNGMPVAIWPLRSSSTNVGIDEETKTLMFRSEMDGAPFRIPASDVLHIHGFSLDGYKGLSFLQYMGAVISLGLSAQSFATHYFENGASPSMIVTHPENLGDGAAARLQEQLMTMYSGLKNAFKVAVLEEGMKTEKLSFDAEQSQLLDMRKDNRVEIAGALRIPPQMIGVYDRATWSNAEQMDIFITKYTLSSWAKRWEQELDFKLLTERQRQSGLYFHINMNALLRGDIKTRTEYYKVMGQGFMPGNEIRQFEDLQPLPGLDEPFVPLNMASVSEAETVGEPEETDTSPAPTEDDEENSDD